MRHRNVEFDVIEYLHNPVGEQKLREFLDLLGVEPKEMLHPGSFAKLGLNIDAYNTPDALVGLLLQHPEVMNRPIGIVGAKAVIARPSERIEELLD